MDRENYRIKKIHIGITACRGKHMYTYTSKGSATEEGVRRKYEKGNKCI